MQPATIQSTSLSILLSPFDPDALPLMANKFKSINYIMRAHRLENNWDKWHIYSQICKFDTKG